MNKTSKIYEVTTSWNGCTELARFNGKSLAMAIESALHVGAAHHCIRDVQTADRMVVRASHKQDGAWVVPPYEKTERFDKPKSSIANHVHKEFQVYARSYDAILYSVELRFNLREGKTLAITIRSCSLC